MKLTSPKTLEIIQYLLENRTFTQQEISLKLDISIGQVNKVITFLTQKQIVEKIKKGYSLKDILSLLKAISLFSDKTTKLNHLPSNNAKTLLELALKNDYNKIYYLLNPVTEKNKKYKIAIIGLGTFGNYHLNKLPLTNKFEIVAISDIIKKDLPFNIRNYINYNELLNNEILDALIISTPPDTHYKILNNSMKKNIPILCESQLTSSSSEFFEIMKYNKLFIGETEIYNPAIINLKQLLQNEEILYIDIFRQGPYPYEKKTQDVTTNLAMHDLYFLTLIKDEIKLIKTLKTKEISRILMQSDETIINLHYDWRTSEKIRKYVVGSRDKTYEVDLISQEIKVYFGTKRNKPFSYEEQIKGVRAGKIEIIKSDKTEPLINEYNAFLEFIKTKKNNLNEKKRYLRALQLLEELNSN